MLYYLLELSRFAHELVSKKPSLIAAGCLLLARATLKICKTKLARRGFLCEDCWNETLQYYTGYSVAELKDTVLIIHSYQRTASFRNNTKEASTLMSVFKKYSKANFMSVSFEPAPPIGDLFPVSMETTPKSSVSQVILAASSKGPNNRVPTNNNQVVSKESGCRHDVTSTTSSGKRTNAGSNVVGATTRKRKQKRSQKRKSSQCSNAMVTKKRRKTV